MRHRMTYYRHLDAVLAAEERRAARLAAMRRHPAYRPPATADTVRPDPATFCHDHDAYRPCPICEGK